MIVFPGNRIQADWYNKALGQQLGLLPLKFESLEGEDAGTTRVASQRFDNPALDFFGRVNTIGSVGNDPRRVRCLAGVRAVSNNGSDSLTILTWDGGENAVITDTVTVGDGPIGVDLRQIGDDVVILSTGSNDNTYSKTTVSLSGAVLDSVTQPILSGCNGPGHIIWVDNSSKAFATCFSSDSYAVFDP